MSVIWGHGARQDFEAAIDFICTESPKGADRIGERVLAAEAMLKDFPECAPTSLKHRQLRQLAVPRTPYLVIYRIHANQVGIRAVFYPMQRRRK